MRRLFNDDTYLLKDDIAKILYNTHILLSPEMKKDKKVSWIFEETNKIFMKSRIHHYLDSEHKDSKIIHLILSQNGFKDSLKSKNASEIFEADQTILIFKINLISVLKYAES